MIVDIEVAQLADAADISRISLEYLLTETKTENNLDSFGVEVIKTTYKNQIKEIEMSKVQDISCSKEETEEILNILAKNTVTPTSLNDVVQDLIVQ